jgi:lipid-A-disaccharide synthase
LKKAARPKLMWVAGETSGDHHAAAAIEALRGKAQSFGLGGPAMQKAGMRLDLDLASRSVIGFVEVLKHAGYFRRAFRLAEALLRDEKPDLLVLVDYPGFNLRLAAKAKALGIQVAYYISPQIWAWKRGRVKTMARILRKMLVTFPFEKPIYDAAGLDCTNVGNPLLDAIPAALLHKGAGEPGAAKQARLRARLGWRGRGPVIGLLPGSREQEVRWLLPVMLATAKRLAAQDPVRRFVVVKPPAAPAEWYAGAAEAQREGLKIQVFSGKSQTQAYEARAAMDFALVASGTATLETALLGTPFCILYRVHPVTYAIGKRLVKIHSIGLANVVAGKRVVPEFLQEELDPEAIAAQSERLLTRPSERRAQRAELAHGLAGLGKPGVAKRVATELLALAREARA